MTEMDTDQSGEVDFEEFEEWWTKSAAGEGSSELAKAMADDPSAALQDLLTQYGMKQYDVKYKHKKRQLQVGSMGLQVFDKGKPVENILYASMNGWEDFEDRLTIELKDVKQLVLITDVASEIVDAMNMAAKQLASEQFKVQRSAKKAKQTELRQLFDSIDADGSGLLDKDELAVLATKLGRTLGPAELDSAMTEMAKDQSGEVHFEEFEEWWTKAQSDDRRLVEALRPGPAAHTAVTDAFNGLDKNPDGSVERGDLSAALVKAEALGRLRRGPSVIMPPHIPFVWIVPIGTANVSDE